MSIPEHRPHSLTTAYVTAAVCSAGMVVYTMAQVTPHPFAALVMGGAPLVTVIIWLQRDARRSRAIAVHDWGFFLWIAWPVLLPWYAVKTRGRRGWLLAGGLAALVLSPWIAAFLASLLWWLA